jgi:inosine-uridine nucleoside N-ribohydrolase
MLKAYQKMYRDSPQHFDYPPVHDPTVINYILHPHHFEVKKVNILIFRQK